MNVEIGYRHPSTKAPTPPLAWQRLAHNDTARGRLAGGAFGAGKSQFLVQDALTTMALFPGTRVGFLRATLEDCRASTMKCFFEDALDTTAEEARKHPLIGYWNRSEHWGRMKNGSEFWFLGARGSGGGRVAGGARSRTFGALYYDEITELGLEEFREWDARLRHERGPNRWAAATNPEPNWVKDRFHPSSKNRVPGVSFFQTRTAENFYLPAGYEASLRRLYPEEWVKRFLDGSWDVFEGQIYTEWDREKHAKWLFEVPNRGLWKEWAAADYGFTNPTVFLMFGQDHDDNVFVWREHYQAGWRPEQHAAVMLPILEDRGVKLIYGCKGFFQTESSGLKPSDEYAKAKIYLTQAQEGVQARIQQVKRIMAAEGKLHVHPSCVELIRELPGQRWKNLTPGRDAYMNAPEEPVDKDNHASEAFGHGLVPSDWGAPSKPSDRGRPEDVLRDYEEKYRGMGSGSSGGIERY